MSLFIRRKFPFSSVFHKMPQQFEMFSKNHQRSSFKVVVILIVCTILENSQATSIGTCIRNCAQCKKMFGPYFEGQLCADTCLKFKGKIIPDCEDISSVAPFLSKFD